MQTLSKGVQKITPAFQWAQSLDHVFLNVKFATRMDSPGCLDTFDPNITIGNNTFQMFISCKIDKQVYRYELDFELFENVDLNVSYFELASVGRLYVNFTKADRPSRWRRLLKQTEKMPNLSLWWELHERYDEALLKHTQFETDEDFMEGLISIDNSGSKKKKGKKAKKAKAAAAATTNGEEQSESKEVNMTIINNIEQQPEEQ